MGKLLVALFVALLMVGCGESEESVQEEAKDDSSVPLAIIYPLFVVDGYFLPHPRESHGRQSILGAGQPLHGGGAWVPCSLGPALVLVGIYRA